MPEETPDERPETADDAPEERPEAADDTPEETPDTADDRPEVTPDKAEVTEGIIPPVPVAPVPNMPGADVEISVDEESEAELAEPGSREAVEAPDWLVLVPRTVDKPTMMPLELVGEGFSAVEEAVDAPVGSRVVSGTADPVPTEALEVSGAVVACVACALELVLILPDGWTGFVGALPDEPG